MTTKQPSSFTFNRYADVFAAPKGPGDARPTAVQIVKDEGLADGEALAHLTILITGASNGLGLETALALATTGARLLLCVRSLDKGRATVEKVEAAVPGARGKLDLVKVDLADLTSVRNAAEEINSEFEKLNILIFNAGIGAPPLGYTKDGYEQQFQINHLSHFLLFQQLKPLLLNGSSPEFASRVVVVSSIAHRWGIFDFADLNWKTRPYSPAASYGASKTACQWTSNEIERRYGAKGLHSVSLHPGGTFETGFGKDQDPSIQAMVKEVAAQGPELMNSIMSPGQCAATQVLAAIGKKLEGEGGLYMEDCHTSVAMDPKGSLISPGYASWAFDEASEKRLWAETCSMLGIEE